ncbi:hypothetical protein niasHT_007298 [Heterodera trifolii]|uniref:Conserved oligomeric Golgi complex subunit 4 n=1 Tax=Heterodera trifolii TaxID=157864 RepID=A0ABD2LL84_9BILA
MDDLNETTTDLKWRPADRANDDSKSLKPLTDIERQMNEIRTELFMARQEEEVIIARIKDEFRQTQKVLGTDNFQRLFDQSVARINAEFERVGSNARQLANSLDSVSGLAQNISCRVVALDLGKSRVVECLQRVNDLKDLGTCAFGVQEALRAEKYEEAAQHIHRFLTLDTAVFKMGDHRESKDAGYSVKNSYEILRSATSELKRIIEQRFDEAQSSGDVASMERFFKLFPLINEHNSGLQRFGTHLCGQIEALGDQNFRIMQAGGTDDKRKNVLYADTLTMLFEGVARIIELHQPIIENFYGPEKLLLLIELIQPECDKQCVRVLNTFIQRRHFEEKAQQVFTLIDNTRPISSNLVQTQQNSNATIDAIELDLLLSEVTLMHTRAELFWRFLRRRLCRQAKETANKSLDEDQEKSETERHMMGKVAEQMDESTDGFDEDEQQRRDHIEKLRKQREEHAIKLDAVLNRSGLSTKMQELMGKFVLVEQFYMTQSVRKAIDMDSVEEGALTSTLLDDVFFIVRKSIRRSISSSSVDCVCAMLNNGATLLETDFLKYISAPIKSGYPSTGWSAESAYQTAQNVMQGKGEVVGGLEKQRSAFITSLNNLRSSIDCVNTLKSGLSEDFRKNLTQISSNDTRKLDNAMSQFDDFARRLEQHANLGIGKLCDALFKPKLKSAAEAFLEVPHCLSDEQLAEFELDDPFISQFVVQLDRLVAQFEALLVPENNQSLLVSISAECVQQLERVVFKCTFNRLGALQLDKEFRELSSYLTSLAGWNVREKCLRLSQMIALLNSESLDEAVEFVKHLQETGPSPSVLPVVNISLNDARRTLHLRNDFSRDQISVKMKILKA